MSNGRYESKLASVELLADWTKRHGSWQAMVNSKPLVFWPDSERYLYKKRYFDGIDNLIDFLVDLQKRKRKG